MTKSNSSLFRNQLSYVNVYNLSIIEYTYNQINFLEIFFLPKNLRHEAFAWPLGRP